MIPFSPPRIDQKVIDEVVDTLKSGWITTGPKTKEFERRLTAYCGNKATLAVNSNTVGNAVWLKLPATVGGPIIRYHHSYSFHEFLSS